MADELECLHDLESHGSFDFNHNHSQKGQNMCEMLKKTVHINKYVMKVSLANTWLRAMSRHLRTRHSFKHSLCKRVAALPAHTKTVRTYEHVMEPSL
jgi:hypothetical protein